VRQVAVHSVLERGEAVLGLPVGGREVKDGNRRGHGIGLQATADLPPVEVGKVNVEDHEPGK
jgi:hypothetical protein